MPLSLDASLALRPDAGTRAREAQANVASDEQRAQFSEALSRVQPPTAATDASAPTLVRATRTRLSGGQAADALRSAWTAVRGEAPSPETLSILVGQWAHETGRGASMLNYNFGGLKGTSPAGLSAAYTTREGWGENATHGVARFRAYGSAEEGAADYVSLLARRYPDAVRAAEQGDAQGFVRALKARGYFTDNEAAYSKSVQSLAALASRAGFDALGGTSGVDAAADPELAPALAAATLPDFVAGASGAPLSFERGLIEAPAAGGTNPLAAAPLAGMPVATSAFADEVNRAALLMSALRIAEPRDSRG
ncbi:MAG TPA: glucosaminidase domain-containing protein [Polyangiaceae bacterium]|nr:glucosaminidase domain-containing protein [Polyangiaceae bacterium]